jgi:transcription initiation factor TFIIH subunit 3
MEPGDASFLAILLENTPQAWATLQRKGLSPQQFIEQLLIFVRTVALLNDGNQIVALAVQSDSTVLLHATPSYIPTLASASAEDDTRDAARAILRRIQSLKNRINAVPGETPRAAAWSGGLLRALCIANKLRTTAVEGQPAPAARLLCLSATPDDPGQYLATMNAIFAAQRAKVLIDGCILGDQHSGFLQQAAYLTGGAYMRPNHPSAFGEYLLTVFAADAASRQYLRLPRPSGVDFRASCFCHKRPTALGFVCSVCLSIYCEQVGTCATCGTEFSTQSGSQQPQQQHRMPS